MLADQPCGCVDGLGLPIYMVAAVERHQVFVKKGQGGLRRAGHEISPILEKQYCYKGSRTVLSAAEIA